MNIVEHSTQQGNKEDNVMVSLMSADVLNPTLDVELWTHFRLLGCASMSYPHV